MVLPLAEDNEIGVLIVASTTTVKKITKKFGRNKMFDQVQSSLDSNITCESFDELL